MVSDEYKLQEPVNIRAHHIVHFANFLRYRPSVEALINALGSDAVKNNFNGYGRGFFENEVKTWNYMAKNQQARIKITDQRDTLCKKCGNRETCVGDPSRLDKETADELTIKIGKIYTVRELIDTIRDEK